MKQELNETRDGLGSWGLMEWGRPAVCTPPHPGDTLDVTLIVSLGHHESPGSSMNTAGCPQRTGLHPYTLGERGKLALGNRWARAGEGSRAGPGPSVRREKTTAVPSRGAPVGSQEPDPPGYKKALAHPDPGQAVYRSPSGMLWDSADGTGVWRSPATLSQELRDQGIFSQSWPRL